MSPTASDKSSIVFDPAGASIIRHEPGLLPEIVDDMELALSDSQHNLFVHAGRVVHLYQATKSTSGVKRPGGALIIHPVETSHLMEVATRAIRHERFDSRSKDWKQCDCPRRVADAFLARGHWSKLPQLAGFSEAPIITQNGRLIDIPGFDPETGLFLAFDVAGLPGYKRPKAKPVFHEARAAYDTIARLVQTFPFVSEADQVAAMASIITALVRRILPAAPMFAVTAPMPGTGKTLLAETPAIIATGRRASVLSLGHDDNEAEKRLGGVLLAGDACILLDNIERPLGGDLLCQVCTQPSVRLRPLGVSSVVNVPTHALMLATGNNLAIVGDLKRRVVLIRMDANVERPEQRNFDNNHLQDVFARRGEIVAAVLTITLAYLQAGSPNPKDYIPFGGFDEWDQMVRRPLLWLGLPDPLKAASALRDQDPDIEAMRLLFNAWIAAPFPEQSVTVSQVITMGTDLGKGDLYDALQLVCSEKIHSRRLGYWLRAHRDRIVDGLQLRRIGEDSHTKAATWQIFQDR